jgi:hypothetical protein
MLVDGGRKQLFHVCPKPTFIQGWQSHHRTPDRRIREPFQPRWSMNHFGSFTNIRRNDELTPSFWLVFSQLSVILNG